MSDLRCAAALMSSKQYAAALPLLQAALRQSEQKPGGPSSADTAAIWDRIGGCYGGMCDFRASAEYFRYAASITDYDIDARISASLNAARAVGNVYGYMEAEKQINISLSLINAELATGSIAPAVLKGHRAMALALSARALKNSGRYSEALSPLIESLAYYESVGNSESLASCLTDLGEIYIEQGLSEKALAMARRAQSLNPNKTASLHALGSMLSQLDLPLEALEYSKRALECEERERGKNTYLYAILQEQIGSLYSGLGQLNLALSWYHRARAGFEKHGQTNTINCGQLFFNIGVVYERTSNLSDALAHYTRAAAIFRGALPPDHSTITQCMGAIATVSAALGNVDDAAAAATAAASTARRSQVQCAEAGCPRKIKADGTPLDQCSGCKRCYYCSKVCQTADWKAGHKTECKELRGGK